MTMPECRFSIGDSSESKLQFTEEGIRRFAEMSGDANPLHHDIDFAKNSRFGGLIACASECTARMIGAVAVFLAGKGGALGLGCAFNYRQAIHAGETLALRWNITEIEEKPKLKGHLVTLRGLLERTDGGVCVEATFNAVVMPPEAMLTSSFSENEKGSDAERPGQQALPE